MRGRCGVVPRAGLALALLVLCRCAHSDAVAKDAAAPAGVPLSPVQAQNVRDRMQRARLPLQQVTLTAKTNRFGPEGRARVTLQLVLQRPAQMRLTVLGPHGPPLFAAACDGAALTSVDLTNKTFRTQPATAAGLAHQLGGLDVGLGAEDWLQLLLGEISVPDDAAAFAGTGRAQDSVAWHWHRGGRRIVATLDSATGRLSQLVVGFADSRVATVRLKGRGTLGLPEQIVMHVSAAPHGPGGAQDVELTLVDAQLLPAPLPDDAFVLAPLTAVPSL